MEMVNDLKQQINVHPKMLNSLKGDHSLSSNALIPSCDASVTKAVAEMGL